MSRLSQRFEQLKSSHRVALIPFITAGDPASDFTLNAMHRMVAAGADVIELGVPFSDPMADGPVIQKASERALAGKMNLRKVLGLVGKFRVDDAETPVVLMGYLNPIEAMGYQTFADMAQKSGVDGVLTVDMPPEESSEFLPLLHSAGIDPIYLLAPNSTEDRIRKMGQLGGGYLYYVSLKGVTGASHLDLGEVKAKVDEIRQLTDLPVGVGFGVRTPEIAAAIGRFADAVVVGSALVSKIEENADNPGRALDEIVELLGDMRSALDDVGMV